MRTPALSCTEDLLGRNVPLHRCLTQAHSLCHKNAHELQHDAATQFAGTAVKRQSAHSHTPTSLRRVALEAQYSKHGLIKRSGKRRFVDPDIKTRDVTAYCAAEQYDVTIAGRLLRQEGHRIDPLGTGLEPQVLHVQIPSLAVDNLATGHGDVFIFPSGTVVTWNVPQRQQLDLINRILLPAATNPHLDSVEIEDLEYLEDPTDDISRIVGDCIILGIRAESISSPGHDHQSEAPASVPRSNQSSAQSSEADTVLAKIAFSSGLARSTKLAVLENLLSSYFSSTRSIPTILSRGAKLRFTRSFILRKTGELLSIRAQLNLYSELTDSLPDLFWDSPSSLGLSDYYDQVARALDVNSRIRVMNEKIDYASEIATILRERLSEKHSTDLEWLIIFLISIEVVFELWHISRERKEAKNPESIEALLKEYLVRERRANDGP